MERKVGGGRDESGLRMMKNHGGMQRMNDVIYSARKAQTVHLQYSSEFGEEDRDQYLHNSGSTTRQVSNP